MKTNFTEKLETIDVKSKNCYKIKENKNENNIFIDNRTLLKDMFLKRVKVGKIYYTTSKWVDNKKMMQIMKMI